MEKRRLESALQHFGMLPGTAAAIVVNVTTQAATSDLWNVEIPAPSGS